MTSFDEKIFTTERFAPIIDFLARRIDPHSALIDQEQALCAMLQGANMLVTGGPGTGKSYLIQKFIEALAKKSTTVQRVAILAPTGKAAARFAGIAHSANTLIETSTIHRSLGLTRGSYPAHHQTNPIAADICIVDEISMVDLGLFAALVDALPRHAQLILAGDLNQLPAVDGTPIDGALDFLRAKQLISQAHLTQTHRFSSEKVALYAQIAQDGLSNVPSTDEFSIRRLKSTAEIFTEVNRYADALLYANHSGKHLPELFLAGRKSMLLTTFREGYLGSQELNRHIRMRRSQDTARPIIATRNDYTHGIFNGDFGFEIVEGKEIFYVFEVAGAYRRFTKTQLTGIELAYALTVHKAQGSEYERVVIVYNENGPSAHLNPVDHRLLYTAVTRAKNFVEVLIAN